MSASITSVLFRPVIAERNRAESRLWTNPIRHPDSVTAIINGSQVPAVGSTTTNAPANGESRSVSLARPANVGDTLKSSRTPGPRIAI